MQAGHRKRYTPEEQLEILPRVLDMGIIPHWGSAIDGGANMGDWTQIMSRHFVTVHAFEPIPETFDRLSANLAGFSNVCLYQDALYSKVGRASPYQPPKRKQHTSAYVKPGTSGSIAMTTIDELDLEDCGLIKIDLEGAEFHALNGAVRTIERCHPVFIIEINKYIRKHYGQPESVIFDFMGARGYKLIDKHVDDHVFKWKGR